MKIFLETLKFRNESLFYYGLVCLFFGIACILISKIHPIQVTGTNAWYKPAKFALSTFLFTWAMAWYMHELQAPKVVLYFNWGITILFSFEIIYIAIQAARGEQSHYNISTPFYSTMYSAMALAATSITLWTAYITILFFTKDLSNMSLHYLWSIRLGLIIFVIFSFEGFVMGGRLSHSIGGLDGTSGLPFLGWSVFHGDPRVAHFVGMHALQVIPLASYYIFRNTFGTLIISIFYALLAFLVLIQALNGKPLIKQKTIHGTFDPREK